MRLSSLLASLLLASMAFSTFAVEPNERNEWYIWSTDETRIYVRSIGKGDIAADPIIVLHGGFGAEHSYLIPALAPLSKNHRFVLFDQRGSLRSPATAKSLTLENLVSDLEQLRIDLRIDKMTLLGHSMGTALAYAYLEKHPEQVKNLILVAPVFPFAPGAAPDNGLLSELGLPFQDEKYVQVLQQTYRADALKNEARAAKQIKKDGLDHEPKSGLERSLKWQIEFAASNIFYLERWRKMRGGQVFYSPAVSENLINNADGWESWSKKWDGFFPALKSFQGKVTFIVGADDFIDPKVQFWPLLAKRLPQARLIIIKRAGHMIWIDQPERFSNSVLEAM